MATTTRAQQLEQLASQLPAANQKIATGLGEARKTQLQESIRQARPGAGTPGVAAQVGAGLAQQAGQQALQTRETQMQQAGQLGQLGLQQEASKLRKAAFEQSISEGRISRDLSSKLENMSRDAKKKIVDDNLKFKVDESGRALLNTQQLADWAVMNAKSDEDMAVRIQDMNQAYDTKIRVMQAAAAKLEQIAKQGYYSDKQKMDAASRTRIMERARDIKLQIEQEKNKKNAQLSKTQALFTVAGTGVGAFLGGPAGAAIGGAVGGAVGSVYASSDEGKQKQMDNFLFTPSAAVNTQIKSKLGI